MRVVDGSITDVSGFKACGVHAGFRKNPERLDFAVIKTEKVCPVAGVFTQSKFCAPCVTLMRERLKSGFGYAQALIVNSGIANAATGDEGMKKAIQSTEIASSKLGVSVKDVLVASTGVIGVQLPIEPFEVGLEMARFELSDSGGVDAAKAIMTTDTIHKHASITFEGADEFSGKKFVIGGITKGSGMIMPNMATMIAILTTDFPSSPEFLHECLLEAVNCSFNKITVDSDTSTNDSCFLFSSNEADKLPSLENINLFKTALNELCIHLARVMAKDGEGATKLVTVNINGAGSMNDADECARSVANSPLVKTAIAGHDANWGRIAAALGKTNANFSQDKVSIDIMGIPVCRHGLSLDFDEDLALSKFEEDEIIIDIDLGAGEFSTSIWTCDFTHDYISINGDYRS